MGAPDDRVEFAGWVSGDRKRELLREASLFALCSLQENFAISLFEAMASGVPGIVSRCVDVAEDVQKASAGWIVEPDRASLKAGLVQAMASDAERGRRGAAARALASRYSWPMIARELTDVYQRVATPSAASHASSLLMSVER
jgi:glycosyltransferase involved in cell wall biosynthesis